MVVGDEDGRVRVFELRAHERRIPFWRPPARGQKALRVEVVMLTDEERAEAADRWQVSGRRAPDSGAGLGVGWRHTEASTSREGSSRNLFAQA